MRLSFSDWPPLISHLAVFFLGTMVAGYGLRPSKPELELDQKSLLVPFAKGSRGSKAEGANLFITLKPQEPEGLSCRMHQSGFKPVGTGQHQIYRVPFQEDTLLALLAWVRDRPRFDLTAEVVMLPLCHEEPRVIYHD